jgi:hypothetical protein
MGVAFLSLPRFEIFGTILSDRARLRRRQPDRGGVCNGSFGEAGPLAALGEPYVRRQIRRVLRGA